MTIYTQAAALHFCEVFSKEILRESCTSLLVFASKNLPSWAQGPAEAGK